MEIITVYAKNSQYTKALRMCAGCGKQEMAIYDRHKGFRNKYCMSCASKKRQKWDKKFETYAKTCPNSTVKKRLYRRVCAGCGKIEYVRVNSDGYFYSPFCRRCSNVATGILITHKSCPLHFRERDSRKGTGCLDCPLGLCFYDVRDIRKGYAVPHKVNPVKRTEVSGKLVIVQNTGGGRQ